MEKKKPIGQRLASYSSFGGLALLVILYLVLMGGNLNAFALKTILNQTVITAVVATGAVFIYTTGAFDISLGAEVAVAALTGAYAYLATNSILVMLLVCVGLAVFIGAFNSILANVFNLPVFVTTIAMLSILNAIVKVLINASGGANVKVPKEAVKPFDTVAVKLVVLIGFFAVCVVLFRYLKIGREEKFIGGNPVCANLTGINARKLTILAFMIAGFGAGLSAFLYILRSPTLSSDTASSIGMDVMISIVFGGMPISGGARSKISSALIGATSMVLLSQIMQILNLGSGVNQLVKGLLFLVVVSLASANYRSELLPR